MPKSRPIHLDRLLTLITAAAFLIGVPAAVMAQSPAPTPGPAKSTSTSAKKHTWSAADEQSRMNEHLKRMTERLKLTDDQTEKVKAIMQAKMVQANELRAKYKEPSASAETMAAREQAHKEFIADVDAKMAQVLTADQMTEYKKMRAEHMNRKGHGREEKEEAGKK